MEPKDTKLRVLVTGATGYIGGRLVPQLVELGHDVTVLVRDPRRFHLIASLPQVQVIQGDLLELESLKQPLTGFDAAFYLVHSMMAGRAFESRDLAAAENFSEVASDCRHVIYLGGLQPSGVASRHLSSRADTGQVLLEHFPGRMTEFRAGPIIGSGSASFEMVRYLSERLPVMITPRWVRTEVSPVAVSDVLAYLSSALDQGPEGIVEIGMPPMPFLEMMQEYARVRGLRRRRLIITPLLAPQLAARWVGFVTPIPNKLAVPLVEGMTQPLTADTRRAEALYPSIRPLPYAEAISRALEKLDKQVIETRWSDAMGSSKVVELVDQEGLIREVRHVEAPLSQASLFRSFSSIGGEKGWLAWNMLWVIRGLIDKLAGGPGLRRGRRDPLHLVEGEALDFWRVERVESPTLLRLRAEMRLPGRAWLQWETAPGKNTGTSILTQTVLFEPKGVWGPLYWYFLYPAHLFIFSDLAKAVIEEAKKMESRSVAPDEAKSNAIPSNRIH
jgi:uncharacterized protein YbjT (DUF2867 family)